MSQSPEKDKEKPNSENPEGNEPKQGKSDPQLTELDGLKKGGVEPTVNPADRARDSKGKPD